MIYGLLGEKLGHSFSREIHERLGRYSYRLIELPPAELEAFLTARDFGGINVTIPYKQAVIPYLDELSPRAGAIGAVNTIVNRNGRLYGDNTDFGGLKALLERAGMALRGKTVLIAGTGGTSSTAMAVAEDLGAARAVRLSRSGREGAMTYEAACAAYPGAEILINTTPAGMYPDLEGTPIELDRLPGLEGVADVIYNPLTTRLVQQARARGLRAENGLYMLVAQAVLAAELFTGERFSPGTAEQLFHALQAEKQNIVLIGMPGSGKTTLGKRLSEKLGRPLADSDAEIVRAAGLSIPEIFRDYGEPYFRDLESRVIRELSRTGGKVIATGGGAVLRQENVDALKQNGVLVFLDRPVEQLTPTGDRPLADETEKILHLHTARYPIYLAAADRHVSVAGTEEETLRKLLRVL